MFSMNRETMTMVAIVIALATCFYLDTENKKNKAELASVKVLVNKPAPPPVRVQPKQPPVTKEADPEPDTE
jgi:hypothetical protein